MKRLTLVFMLLSVVPLRAVDLNGITRKFKNFEYDTVVRMADSLLAAPGEPAQKDILELYRLKGVSHFSLLEMRQSLASFAEILERDPGFSMDPVQTSPKILDFFNEIKTRLAQRDTVVVHRVRTDTLTAPPDGNPVRNTVWRSMVLPGWGHLFAGQKTKGRLLAGPAALCLGAAVYYSVDCHSKHRDYMNEVDPRQIGARYDRWNACYQKRNIFVLTFAAIWIYTQADILFFPAKQNKWTVSCSPSGLKVAYHF